MTTVIRARSRSLSYSFLNITTTGRDLFKRFPFDSNQKLNARSHTHAQREKRFPGWYTAVTSWSFAALDFHPLWRVLILSRLGVSRFGMFVDIEITF